MKRCLLPLLFILQVGLLTPGTLRAEVFTIADIRLQGLQRISAGTVFNLLPVAVGERIDDERVAPLVRTLFRSGYFSDVQVLREGNVLVLRFVERPAVDAITLDGNKSIPDEALLDGLRNQGLAEGEIFKRATLERMELELERQYVAQGRYGASIEATVDELPRNRVAITIEIDEGKPAGILHINVTGNTIYDDAEILDRFELKHPGLISFYTNDDKYSREKLAGDLEKLEGLYQDNGYVTFRVVSTQVAVSPDRKDVYITINVEEGEQYTVDQVDLIGELHDVKPEALEPLLLVREGQVFNRARLTATEEYITNALGNAGYTFASATGIPEPDEDGTVAVKFFVDAGQRAYVRRVNFSGNTVTQDEVLRREMRQMEGGYASTAQIELSKVRLERLGYFADVNVETVPVPGRDDQVDVNFNVEEQPSGSISATLGFAQASGLILGANYQENNVLGTGNSLGVNISWSKFQQSLSFSFFDPYYTMDGVSRGYQLFYRKTDFDERNIATFSTDTIGGGLNFGFPIGETQRIGFGLGFEDVELKEGVFAAQEIGAFIDDEGKDFLNFTTNLTWRRSTLNRGLFPTAGSSQSLSFEATLPGSEVNFFKLRYEGDKYFNVWGPFTGHVRTEIGYAAAYGGTDTLPFFEHFFAGGFGSIRGFEANTLGPRTTPNINDPFDPDGDPFGGNLLIEGSLELIFPMPFVEDNRQFRPALFVDVGNVFQTNCKDISRNCLDFSADEFRYAVGAGVSWITGLGPMTFALAFPFNDSDTDETEVFQFELGKTF